MNNNKFYDELVKTENFTTTENGAVALKSTLSKTIDLFINLWYNTIYTTVQELFNKFSYCMEVKMKVRYDKLWRLMRNNKMKKSELAKAAEISSYTMTKLNNECPVNMEVMINLCKVFHCDIGDLMEVIEEE